MTTSLLAKLSIVAAATMLTFSPALADRSSKHAHGYSHNHSHGYNSYKKRKHARQVHRHRHHRYHAHRRSKPRLYWNYAYRPYRGW